MNTNISIKKPIEFIAFVVFCIFTFSCQNGSHKHDVKNKKEKKLYDDLTVKYANIDLPYYYPDSMFYKYFEEAIEEEVKCEIYDSTSTAFMLVVEKTKNKTEIIIASLNKIIYKYYNHVKGVFVYKNYDFYFEGEVDKRLVSFTDSIVNREYLEYNYRPEIDRSTWYYDINFPKKELILAGRYVCHKSEDE